MTRNLTLWLGAAVLVAVGVSLCPAQPSQGTVRDYSMNDAASMIREGKGSVVMFHLYASWCKYCKEEMPDVMKVAERYKSHPFQLLAFSTDLQPENLRMYLKGSKFKLDPRRMSFFGGEQAKNVFRPLGMRSEFKGIPYTAIFDPSGTLVSEWNGRPHTPYQTYVGVLDGIFLRAEPTPAKDPPPTKTAAGGTALQAALGL